MRTALMALAVLCTPVLRADVLVLNGVGEWSNFVNESITISGYTDQFWVTSGQPSRTVSFGVNFGSAALPVGSVIHSAKMQITAPASSYLWASSIYQGADIGEYLYQPGYCDAEGCYPNVYYPGRSGSVGFQGYSSTTLKSVSVGTGTAFIATAGGTFDLLGLGLGKALLAGDTVSVTGSNSLSVFPSFIDWGYYAITYYEGVLSTDQQLRGVLTIDYSSPVPEPASWALLGTLAAPLFIGLRRKLS